MPYSTKDSSIALQFLGLNEERIDKYDRGVYFEVFTLLAAKAIGRMSKIKTSLDFDPRFSLTARAQTSID